MIDRFLLIFLCVVLVVVEVPVRSLSGCQIALQDGNLALKRLAQTGVFLFAGIQTVQRFLQLLDLLLVGRNLLRKLEIAFDVLVTYIGLFRAEHGVVVRLDGDVVLADGLLQLVKRQLDRRRRLGLGGAGGVRRGLGIGGKRRYDHAAQQSGRKTGCNGSFHYKYILLSYAAAVVISTPSLAHSYWLYAVYSDRYALSTFSFAVVTASCAC